MDPNNYRSVVCGETELINATRAWVFVCRIDVDKGVINKLIYSDLPTREAHSKVVTGVAERKINKDVAGVES